MKKGLLTAVSLVLAIGLPALAQGDRETSAGASKAVKLGGDERNPQRQAMPQRPSDVVKTSDTQASNNDPQRPNQETKPKSKGLIPPPPPGTTIGKDAGEVVGVRKKKKKAAATAEATTDITVASGSYRLTGGKSEEQFTTLFNWQPDDAKNQNQLTFTATYTPLGGSGVHFNWLRIMMGGRMLYTERTLQGKNSVTMDMTGQIPSGTNQMVIQGQGSAGATVEWKITTPIKVKLTSVNPDEVVVGGDVTLKGSNFDTTPTKDIVTIANKQVTVNKATATELKLKIPKNFQPGETEVKVTVNGMASKPLKITIRGIPELTGTNFNGVPPGAELTVFGKNFSKKLGENQVFFGETAASVVSGTTEQLVVVVPNFYADMGAVSGQVGIPIKVKVGKIESSNTVPVTVGNSMWEDPGLKGGPDVPQVPVDWRRLLEN